MIKRNTWILLGVFVVLLGVAYYLQSHPAASQPVTTPTPGGPAPLFNNLDEKTISSLSVKDQAGKILTIGRDAAGLWSVIEPAGDQSTDPSKAEQSVSQLVSLTGQPILNQKPDLSVYGLANPSAEITLLLSGGQKDTLQIGAEAPFGDGYYARMNAGPVQVVAKLSLDPILALPANPPYQLTPTP